MMTVHRRFTGAAIAFVVAIPLLVAAREQAASRHFPPAGEWARRDPAAMGLDPAKLDAAIKAALATENTNTRDLSVDIPNSFRNEAPYNNLIGPTQERAGANLLVIYKGYAVASVGDTARADMSAVRANVSQLITG